MDTITDVDEMKKGQFFQVLDFRKPDETKKFTFAFDENLLCFNSDFTMEGIQPALAEFFKGCYSTWLQEKCTFEFTDLNGKPNTVLNNCINHGLEWFKNNEWLDKGISKTEEGFIELGLRLFKGLVYRGSNSWQNEDCGFDRTSEYIEFDVFCRDNTGICIKMHIPSKGISKEAYDQYMFFGPNSIESALFCGDITFAEAEEIVIPAILLKLDKHNLWNGPEEYLDFYNYYMGLH